MMQTPGVYIKELDAFGTSIAPVETAVPCFIGYTSKTNYQNNSLIQKPVVVNSFTEYMEIFGDEPPCPKYDLAAPTSQDNAAFSIGSTSLVLAPTTPHYRMHSSLKFFYENGGRDCYVISLGSYEDLPNLDDLQPFRKALELLKGIPEPSLVVIPDVIELPVEKAYELECDMINHCAEIKSRFAILDLPMGDMAMDSAERPIQRFRDNVGGTGANQNSYAAAYYPWLHTTIYQAKTVSYKNLSSDSYAVIAQLLTDHFTAANGSLDTDKAALIAPFSGDLEAGMSLEQAHQVLSNGNNPYSRILTVLLRKKNILGPAAAMAGIYTKIDQSEGVWKAPANVSLMSTVEPTVKINNEDQEDLNVPIQGKAVCAIRNFPGLGTVVWGARTMDGNSLDYKYINVRRTLIYLEESIKSGIKAFVFAPNDAKTWEAVKSMISQFLTDVWRQGGLAGAKASEAFSVLVGPGSTMTNADIIGGTLRVLVQVALSHPAEFIVLSFEQEMAPTP